MAHRVPIGGRPGGWRALAGACLAWLALGAAGCATTPVSVDYDPEVEFLFYTTFAWLGHAGAPRGEPESLPAGRVHRAVADALAAHGITEADPATADLWVRYRTKVHREVLRNPRVIELPERLPPGHPGDRHYYRTYVYVDKTRYYVGTLTIELVDRKVGRVVWEGSTSEAAVHRDTAGRPTAEAAARVMAAFPPPHE